MYRNIIIGLINVVAWGSVIAVTYMTGEPAGLGLAILVSIISLAQLD